MNSRIMLLSWRTPILLLALCLGYRAFAQFSAATVTGAVQDSTRAGITGANLKLINTQTGTENDSSTNQEGGFLLPGVIPGAYTLQIEHDGFATTQVNGIVLNAGVTKNLMIRMKIGAVTETVNVDASGLTLNRTNATVSTVVDRKLIATVPLNGRSLQDLILLTPGIVTQSPQAATLTGSQTQGDFSVNGQRPDSNMFFVDGVSANVSLGLTSGASRISNAGSIAGTTALGTTQSLVSADALEEFRVLTSTYSAEYGRTPGGQFTFLTRSGTNKFHGSIYDYFRGDPLDAADWFSGMKGRGTFIPPHYTQNNFGATGGGPVVLPGSHPGPPTSFVFASYEGLDLFQPSPQTYNYTPDFCAPNPESCDFYIYEGRISPQIAALLNTFPFPGLPILDASGNSTGMSQATIQGTPFPARVDSVSVRLDHNFTPKISGFVRFGDTPSHAQSNELDSVTGSHLNTHTWTVGGAAQISGTQNDEFRLGYLGSSVHSDTTPEQVSGANPTIPAGNLNYALGVPGLLNVPPALARIYASASAEAYVHITGVGDSDSNTNLIASSLSQWNLRDTYSVQTHNHLFRFGVDEQHISSHVTPPSLSILADFFTPDSLVNNSASDLVTSRSLPANPVLNEFSLFAEDQWKASPRLNLSAGLRWDVSPAPKGQHGEDAYTVLGDVNAPATLQLAPRGTALWHTSWLNFAPRIGAAWQVKNEPGRELIVRAGGGVFFDTAMQPALRAFNGIGFTSYAHFLDAPVPATSSQINVSTAVEAPYTNQQVFSFAPHLQLPYSWQWNISMEQALGRNQSVTLSYVGASGRRLLAEQQRNVSALNPDFGDVSYFPSRLTSSFESLQTEFQRSMSRGIEVLASYTWAHSFDYGSSDPFYPLVRGNSDLDVRQNLEAAASWALKPQQHRFFRWKRLSEGWGFDGRLIARTGFPVNLLGNFSFDQMTGRPYYSGVDLIPGRPLYLHGSQYPGRRMFNGGQNAVDPALALPDAPSAGDAPRNLLRGFPEVQGNFGIRQTYQFWERVSLQLKIEAFNVFNHPNFGYIDPSFSDLLFGQSTKMLDQSFGNAGALYNQGGPRALQVSVKATF
jgi:Carboxypeptidase regulatory-like domain/TonB dependent receptor/TonB-dependent Receptor Plug Domain